MGVRPSLVIGAAGVICTVLAAAYGSPHSYHWDLPNGFPAPRVPADNPMSEEKARLGRYLFYDVRLSGNGTQSCASCHQQELAFTDGRATGLGSTGESHSRSAMSLVNVAYNAALTWSNPTLRSLEEQALIPLRGEHPVELGFRGVERLRSDHRYQEMFRRAFAESRAFDKSNDPFTVANVTKALGAFERSIISARSPYDRYYRGGEADAISEAAKRGELLFYTAPLGGCFRCHGGFNFSDATESESRRNSRVEFHNTALYNEPGRFSYPAPNVGIYEYTKRAADVGKFKAPTLRNIALTAPYMHDGSIATLEEVLEHYTKGGRAHDNPLKDARMTGLHLTAQNRADLLEFLRSLTDIEVTQDPRFGNPWEIRGCRDWEVGRECVD